MLMSLDRICKYPTVSEIFKDCREVGAEEMNAERFQDMVLRCPGRKKPQNFSYLQHIYSSYIQHFKLHDRTTKHKLLKSRLTPMVRMYAKPN